MDKWKYKEIVSPCIARFRVIQYDGQGTSSLEWNIVAVKNLSAGGIKINYYKKKLEIGSLLDLKIEFIKSISTISCIGRVVHIEDAHTNAMFRMGVEFTEINDKDREIINTTVEAILKKEKQGRLYLERLSGMKNYLARGLRIARAIDVSGVEKALKKTKMEPVGIVETGKLENGKSGKPSDIKGTHLKAVSGNEAYDPHAKPRERIQRKGYETLFIVAYMVLMPILGFIAHRDLTKQLNRVETKLDNIEKLLSFGETSKKRFESGKLVVKRGTGLLRIKRHYGKS